MYDTVVIGNDLSSLIAATILSHSGKKTVFLSEGDNPNSYTESGYTFTIDPSPLTGFGPAQILSLLFKEIAVPIDEVTGLRLVNPGLQIILPDHRIDLFYDQEALFNDLEREFSDHIQDIRTLYTSALKISDFISQWIHEKPNIYPKNHHECIELLKEVPSLMKERFLYAKALHAIKKHHSLSKVFETSYALFSNVYTDPKKTFSLLSAHNLSMPLRGLFYHEEGNAVLTRLLKSRFEDSGGHHINNCSVIRINADNEIDVDIKAANELSVIHARYLIVSTKWEKIPFLLCNHRKCKRLERRLKSTSAAYYPFTLHMGVFEKGIPEKMATSVAVIVDSNRPVMDNNLVFLEISANGDTKRAPSGKRALSATVFLKDSPLVLNNEALKEISEIVFKNLEAFLPFLKENIDVLDIDKSIELSRKYQDVINQKYRLPSDSFFGMVNLSNKTPMRNVYITGGMLLAGLGFEGEVLSGMNAAYAVIKRGE